MSNDPYINESAREEKIQREAEAYMDDFGTFVEAIGEMSADRDFHSKLKIAFFSLKFKEYMAAGAIFESMFKDYCYRQAEDVYEMGKL
jgi:hypothetical protein